MDQQNKVEYFNEGAKSLPSKNELLQSGPNPAMEIYQNNGFEGCSITEDTIRDTVCWQMSDFKAALWVVCCSQELAPEKLHQ